MPCPGRDSAQRRPPFASTKPRAIASPSPAPAGRLRRGRTARRRARGRPPGSRAPGRRRGRSPPCASPSIRTCTTPGVRRELDGVLDQVREHALELAGVDADERRLAGDEQPAPWRRRRRPRRGRGRRAPRSPAPARPRRPRAATGRAGRRRGGSAGPSRGRSSRAARGGPARSARASRCAALPTAVRMPVSGERRSCETARSSAVLTRSLRRSVSASSASRSSASRSTATASSAASAGRKRLRTARFGSAPRRRGDRPHAPARRLQWIRRLRPVGARGSPELDRARSERRARPRRARRRRRAPRRSHARAAARWRALRERPTRARAARRSLRGAGRSRRAR